MAEQVLVIDWKQPILELPPDELDGFLEMFHGYLRSMGSFSSTQSIAFNTRLIAYLHPRSSVVWLCGGIVRTSGLGGWLRELREW